MTELEKKINFGDGQNYLDLVEVAKDSFFSFSYLLESAKRGKLKAFKFGADWFTTSDWLKEFKSKIKRQLEEELKAEPFQKWVRYLPKERPAVVVWYERIKKAMVFIWQRAMVIISFWQRKIISVWQSWQKAVFSSWKKIEPLINLKLNQRLSSSVVTLTFLISFSIIIVSFAQSDNNFNRARIAAGQKFLVIVDYSYRLPGELLRAGSVFYLKMFNLSFGGLMAMENHLDNFILASAGKVDIQSHQLAGIFSTGKIYDEKITELLRRFLRDKLHFLLLAGKVAGESE